MRKRVFKTFAAAALATTIAGTTIIGSTAFADEISTLTQQKQDKQNELDQLQQQAAYLLTEMSSLEQDMADLSDEIDQTNADLEAAQQLQQKQFDDTKLRIKYMYEDQSTSISDVFLTASDMSDVINKASYMQQVYDYDRNKLEEMAATAASIAEYKSDLETKQAALNDKQKELTNKQATLYTAIDAAQSDISNFDELLAEANEKAAKALEQKRQAEAARAAATSGQTTTKTKVTSIPTSANNDSSVASNIVSIAYRYVGVPYRSGGASPSGFDCSGLVSYVLAQAGISGVARSSSSQAYGGVAVSGGISAAQPGDVICYPGHVGIYIGGGHLKQSSVHWMAWGIMCVGRYLTAKISEFHSHKIECSLSDILEDNVPEKYYLSRKQAEKLLYKEKPTQGERIYSSKGLSCTLTSGLGGFGGHSGLYLIEDTKNFGLLIKSNTKAGYQIAYPGDSIDTAFSG